MSEGLEPGEVEQVDRRLAAALPPGTLYAVGGRVRDEVRAEVDGIPGPLKDLDYVAVGLSLSELIERLRAAGRAELVGASFAVVKWSAEGLSADVALPRRERSTGIGHREFEVSAGPDITLEEDLGRRDFRMNMLARAIPQGAIVDPFGGVDDIRAARIDLLRAEAFDEDPLRMLRAAQFAARFGFTLTAATIEAGRAAAASIATVSSERVRDELMKLLGARSPSTGFEALRDMHVLPVLLPELTEGIGVEQNDWHRYDVYRHTLATLDATPDDLVLRLAALFHDVAKPRTVGMRADGRGATFYGHDKLGAEMARDALERLRFPGETIETAATLVAEHLYLADPEMDPRTIRRFVRRVGVENLERLFAL
ncbi:MAG TPA: HD domain-containing protein, partial [Candidatus Baltobacteraceae bacterium]|nr:HD domain-containing protein [Candidatus Baltobacteraceae bacterium]